MRCDETLSLGYIIGFLTRLTSLSGIQWCY